MLSFPVEILLGKLGGQALAIGFALMAVWVNSSPCWWPGCGVWACATTAPPERERCTISTCLKAFYRNAILVELEYRVNFLINVFMTAFWFAWTLVSVRIFYRFTDTIGGWTYPQALLVIGLFSCANAVIWGLVRPNVEKLVEGIRSGTFDFVLMKPVNSQFIASLRHLVIWQFSNLALGIAVLFIAAPRSTIRSLLVVGCCLPCCLCAAC